MPQRIAAIDIGSNSVRQIVADVLPSGRIRPIDEMKAMPRLGEGMEQNGALNSTAAEAAVEAVQRMVLLAHKLSADRIEIVATSAVRDASNSSDFTSKVLETTGIPVRVLSGEEEALLCFRSALAHFELGAGRTVVVDIGGGSLEMVLAKDGLIERIASLPFGAVRLTEKFLQPEIRPKAVRELRTYVRDAIKQAVPVKDWRGAQVIGSGGTFTNLAGIILARSGLSANSIHGTKITRAELEQVLELLQGLSQSERSAIAGLNPARSDIIVAGLSVAAEVMARFESFELRSSAYGIREGILLDAARIQPVISDPGAAREKSVQSFAERCHFERPHSEQVKKLSLQLFDSLSKSLRLEKSDRIVLADAALLHDVGYLINYDNHHKHSFHLISHAELLGMTPSEQIAIAHIARYHRGSAPKRSHRSFAILDRAMRNRIVKLAAILRIADGFDRGHVGAIDSLSVNETEKHISIKAIPKDSNTSIKLELWGAARKRHLLETISGKPVRILTQDGIIAEYSDDSENN